MVVRSDFQPASRTIAAATRLAMNTEKPDPLLLTIPDVARLLSVSRASVYTLINHGRLRSVTPLGHQRVPRSEVTRLLREIGVEGDVAVNKGSAL